jgi:CDP-diacylglycerol--glycerol-3-phosphate 3-phosphatidyltransferase
VSEPLPGAAAPGTTATGTAAAEPSAPPVDPAPAQPADLLHPRAVAARLRPDAGLVPDPAGDPPAAGVSNWNLPNALTCLRLLLVPVFLVALLAHGGASRPGRWIALGIFVAASVTDRLDGEIARSRNLVTSFGKVADPIADKALIGAALVALSALDVIDWWITVVILAREVGVTLLRFAVIRHGIIPASRGGKVKTLLQGMAVVLCLVPVDAFALTILEVLVLGLAVVATVLTGLDYVVRALALRRAALGRRP